MTSLFHLAFNVIDLTQARHFYLDLLGCKEGRSTATWVDIDFFRHQLSFVIKPMLRFAGETGKQHTMFLYGPFNPMSSRPSLIAKRCLTDE